MTAAHTAFLFPGQGAQTVGMGLDAYEGSAAARAVFDEAGSVLGQAIPHVIFEGPSGELTRSSNAQPALLAVSIAYLRALEERLGDSAPDPAYVAGHSLGEYTALVASGSLSLAEGLRLVRLRGEAMQQASDATPSGMAALIGMQLASAQAVCAETGAEVANVNSEQQIVIAGPREELNRAIGLASERGARRAIPLEVAGAFHSQVMRPAQDALKEALLDVEIRTPSVPLVANTTGRPMTEPEAIRAELAQQVCAPVLWQQSVEFMAEAGVQRFVEIGPGNVLTGLAKRIAPGCETANVRSLDGIAALA